MIKISAKPGFLKRNKKQKNKKQKAVALKLALFLIIAITLLGLFFEVWQNFNRSLWDDKETFYFLVGNQKNFLLIKADKQNQNAVLGQIPGNTVLNTAYGFGQVLSQNIYKLAQVEQVSALKFLTDSFSLTFGLPVSGVVFFPGQSENQLHLEKALWLSLFGFGKTNMSRWDTARLAWFFSRLDSSGYTRLNFSDAQGLKKNIRPDGLEVIEIDQKVMDIWLSQKFVNQDLVNEPLTWEVINISDHQGLAGQLSRLLTNIGFQVVQLTRSQDQMEEGVYIGNDAHSKGAFFLAKHLQLDLYTDLLPEGSRGEAVVVVGDQYWQKCCTRNFLR